VNVGEADFQAVASAALTAKASGDMDEARALDKLARKINLALSSDHATAKMARMMGADVKRSWRDIPSVLEPDCNESN
jgi:hypothetical protein